MVYFVGNCECIDDGEPDHTTVACDVDALMLVAGGMFFCVAIVVYVRLMLVHCFFENYSDPE